MWYKHNFFKYATGIILCLTIIYLLGKIDYFLNPFKQFIATIFFPLALSGLFYYILRPAVRCLEKLKFPRTLSIIGIISAFTVLLVFAGIYSSSMIVDQLGQLASDFPRILEASEKLIVEIFRERGLNFVIPLDVLQNQVLNLSRGVIDVLPDSILKLISALANVATVLLLVPFILFYLLKDDHLFAGYMLKLLPHEHRKNGEEILEDIDKTLSAYITSQAIIAVFIGLLMYIGYLVIGLKYAFILALFAAVTSIIPIVGSVLGILPAVLVGFSAGPFVVIKILIIAAIVQTLQGNLISPLVMGKKLDIHPLTYIIIFLASASLYGFIGMLVAVPIYAVLKVTLSNLYRIYKLRKP